MPGLRDVVLSVHCHDDLGLAVANSFAGVQAGARQVECAINGIGERAGNASLEEIVMLLHTRRADVGLHTGVVTREIARTSRLVSRLTGYAVQPNKAIVGRNAFAHESGIHQDGVLKERSTYEIMDATTVGLDANAIVLGKHSGRHALRQALEELGYQVDGQALNTAFKRFKEIADKKKQVTAMDLEALVTDELRDELAAYTLEWFDVEASSRRPPHATVGVRTPEGEELQGSFTGDGPVDAIFRAINAATGLDARLREFRVDAVTGGQDALGEVSVVVELAPRGQASACPACSCASAPPAPARPSRPTSSRRRASPTCARSTNAVRRVAGRRPPRTRAGARARHAVIDRASAGRATRAALVQVPSVDGRRARGARAPRRAGRGARAASRAARARPRGAARASRPPGRGGAARASCGA